MGQASKLLTELQVKAAKWSGRVSQPKPGKEPTPLPDVLPDGGGLYLSVSPTTKAWILRLYTGGKERRIGLGVYREDGTGVSLKEARAATAREQVKLRATGMTKADEKRQERERKQAEEAAQAAAIAVVQAAKEREARTVGFAALDYHRRVIIPSRTPKHSAQWITSLQNHLPAILWNKPLAEVSAPELLQALQGMKPHQRARNLKGETVPETQQRVRQRLDAIFEDAIFHGWCGTNPAAGIKRKLRETMPRKRKGSFAALPYAEAPEFMRRLRQAEGIAARCLELGMLTAGRTNELIKAHADEFDLEQGVWVVEADRMKAREPHTVFLSPRAIEIVRAQLEFARHPKAERHWLFPSPQLNGKPLSNMAMLSLLGRLGVRDETTVHGLCRATFSTWANETGAARPDVTEACLAHEESDRVRAAYNRAEFAAERRALLEAWTNYLNGTPPAKQSKRRGPTTSATVAAAVT